MSIIAKPFLKWAGGKTQLIPAIEKSLPTTLWNQKFTYVEPFVGSGAILFWIISTFPNLEKAVINDINADLVNTYRIIAKEPNVLIGILKQLEGEFHALKDDDETKKEYYYNKRAIYNSRSSDKCSQAALFIFLNRTCFNGLYRVNSKNEFNVPMGSYKAPTICDKYNILAVSEVLQKVEITHGDFETTINYASEHSFFYLDPPYKPLSQTSSFNAYAMDEFNDATQIRLRDFCNLLDKNDFKWMLSNSDVKGKDPNDDFFDDIYGAYNITRVKASRRINANAEKRGELNELLITNYTYEQAESITQY